MEVNSEFKIEDKNGKIVLNQTRIQEMSYDEAILELTKLEGEIAQLDKQIGQTEKLIAEDKLNNDLKKLNETKTQLKDLKLSWATQIEPYYEELKTKLSADVKVEKAQKGWSRIGDANQKQIVMNQILAGIAHENNFDMTHPVMKDLKAEFERI